MVDSVYLQKSRHTVNLCHTANKSCQFIHTAWKRDGRNRKDGSMEKPRLSSVQFSSAAQSCPTLFDPMDCSTPGFPVHHQLPEFTHSSPLSWWCHPTISSSVVPFSAGLQSFPASGSFQMSQFFASGGQSIGVSASISVLPMNTQDWFPLGLTGLISLQSKGLSRIFSNTTVPKHQFFSIQLSYLSNSHIHIWLLEKP